jgi:hypothetical protein
VPLTFVTKETCFVTEIGAIARWVGATVGTSVLVHMFSGRVRGYIRLRNCNDLPQVRLAGESSFVGAFGPRTLRGGRDHVERRTHPTILQYTKHSQLSSLVIPSYTEQPWSSP